MSTSALRPPTVHDAPTAPVPPASPGPCPAVGDRAVARFLTGVAVTLLPLLAALVTFELGWPLLGANTWSAAVAVIAGWTVASAGWLCLRRWPAGAVLTVIGAPAVVLAVAAAVGWLSPAGLVLWGPLSTVLAVPLVMPVQPVSSDRRPPGSTRGADDPFPTPTA
jgi:hypothetical protein